MDVNSIKLIVLDFDGVLTSNKVFINEHGEEFVECSRADGLAFDTLRMLQMNIIILSTEANKVVSSRADKLKVKAIQGVGNKKDVLSDIMRDQDLNKNEVVFVGNDVNDIDAMHLCGLTFCPSDAHALVKQKAKKVLKSIGGNGVMREIVEEHFELNIYNILFN